MKEKIFVLLFFIGNCAFSQVGIGTLNPQAKLDIRSSSLTTPTNTDGILIPKMDYFPAVNPGAAQDGMLVFITGNGTPTKGFYYWDQNSVSWKPVGGSGTVTKINDLLDGKSDNDGTQDYSSVFLGWQAGFNDDQNDNKNVGIGYQASYNNAAANECTAVGYQALYNNSGGSDNTAIGFKSLFNNIGAHINTAVGYLSLYSNQSGGGNSAFGSNALWQNLNGSGNCAFGSYALYSNFSGANNVAVGSQTLQNNTTGDGNTALGTRAFWYGLNYSNSTALGAYTYPTASNQVRVGAITVTSIGGYANWTNVSDGRFKTDIRENVPGLDFILKLRPVTYHLDLDKIDDFLKLPDSMRTSQNEILRKFKAAKEQETQTGFIAQEVEQAAKSVGYDFSGVDKPKNENDYYGLRYAEFVVPLVKAVQEQQKLIQAQQKEIDKLKSEIQSLKKLVLKNK